MPINSLKNVIKFPQVKIPTRFDDIQREIAMEKAQAYYNQTPKITDNTTTYTLGSIIGSELGKKLHIVG